MTEIYDAQEFLEDPVRDRVIRGTVSCVPEARGKIRLRALGGIQAPRHVTIRFTADSFRGNVVIGVGPGPASCVVASAGATALVVMASSPGLSCIDFLYPESLYR